jgi:hypothetical protein
MADQKIMTRIMKLLERANHPETPEAERQACLDKADAMMAQHMIDRMDLKPEEKTKVVEATWDLSVGEAGSEFRQHVIGLMQTVVRHNGIRIHPRTQYAVREDGTTNWSVIRYKLVGFPEDMAYAEQIWFRVFKEFVSNVNPTWDTTLSVPENVYQFVRAGLAWGQIHAAATRNGVELPPVLNGGGAKLRKMYKEECKRREEEYYKTRQHDAYRTSFARSFSSTIAHRLAEMREKSKDAVGDDDKFALAVRSTKERVDEEFYRLYPEYDPEVIRRMREAEEFEAACRFAMLSEDEQAYVIAQAEKEQADWEKKWRAREARASRARRNYGYVRERNDYDASAWQRGESVASRVNLSVDPEVKRKEKGQISG